MKFKSYLVTIALFSTSFIGCSDDSSGDDNDAGAGGEAQTGNDDNGDDNDEECAAPSDTLSTDDFSAGQTSVICYYAPSEGYCRELSGEFQIAYAEAGDKGAMGCTDAVVVTGGTCPLDTAVGRCVNWGTDESRVYYECNKFDTIYPDGLEKGCTDFGGTWEAF